MLQENHHKHGYKPLSGGFHDQINTQRPEYFASLAMDLALAVRQLRGVTLRVKA